MSEQKKSKNSTPLTHADLDNYINKYGQNPTVEHIEAVDLRETLKDVIQETFKVFKNDILELKKKIKKLEENELINDCKLEELENRIEENEQEISYLNDEIRNLYDRTEPKKKSFHPTNNMKQKGMKSMLEAMMKEQMNQPPPVFPKTQKVSLLEKS